jgi:SEC-C motif-containing protein
MEPKSTLCPCGSTKPFAACCAPYVEGNAPAPDACALMRSRYTAYTQLREDYLMATWHTSTRPVSLDLGADVATKWIGLEVKRHEQQDTDHAIVEFVARYKVNGRAHLLHEVSRFVREDGRWFYVDGDVT